MTATRGLLLALGASILLAHLGCLSSPRRMGRIAILRDGNIESRSDDCNDFRGVFNAYGRIRPDMGYGDPLPNRRPTEYGSLNEAFLSELIGCYPDCSLGMSSLHSAFAFRYHGGALEWAAIHSPSGDAVYHGRHEIPCENGVLAHTDRFEIRLGDFPLFPFPRGSSEDIRYLVINTDGSLVSYDAHSFQGTALLVIPVRGTRRDDDWWEFPPDPAIDRDLDALFESLSPPADSEVVKVGDPKANPAHLEWQRRQPKSFTVKNFGSGGMPFTRIRGVDFRLWKVGVEKGRDGYYTTYAELDARHGREWMDVRLERSHRPGVEPEYRRIFDEEVALSNVRVANPGTVSSLNPLWAFLIVKREPSRDDETGRP